MQKKFILAILMTIPIILGVNTVYADDDIPAWVKGVAGFWAEDKITDKEFIEALEFLIDSGIIKVDNSIKESIIAEPSPPFTETQNFDRKNIIDTKLTYDAIELGALSKINIDFITPQTQKIQEHIDFSITVSKDGETVFGPLPLTHTSTGSVTMPIEFDHGAGLYEMDVTVSGILFQPIPDKTKSFDVIVGQEIPSDISVHTDKSSYEGGETVKISGTVTNPIPSKKTTITIISPLNSIVTIDQLIIAKDGSFETAINTAGSMWKYGGTYTVRVDYEISTISDTTTFELSEHAEFLLPYTDVKPGHRIGSFEITDTIILVPDSDDLIKYHITGGELHSVTPYVDTNSLIMNINALSNGSLELIIPRSILDAKINGMDDDFFVLVDGEEYKKSLNEKISSSTRTLTIYFSAGVEEIEIIGTWVISK